jgi:hypothetical protein
MEGREERDRRFEGGGEGRWGKRVEREELRRRG